MGRRSARHCRQSGDEYAVQSARRVGLTPSMPAAHLGAAPHAHDEQPRGHGVERACSTAARQSSSSNNRLASPRWLHSVCKVRPVRWPEGT